MGLGISCINLHLAKAAPVAESGGIRTPTQLHSHLFVETSVHARSQLTVAALKKCKIRSGYGVFCWKYGITKVRAREYPVAEIDFYPTFAQGLR
jgi:hypothetical protein